MVLPGNPRAGPHVEKIFCHQLHFPLDDPSRMYLQKFKATRLGRMSADGALSGGISRRFYSLSWFLVFLSLAVGIFIEALHAPTIDDQIIPHLDKMAHVAAFGMLAFLLFQAVRSSGVVIRWPATVVMVLAIAVLGAMDEWVQSFSPGRMASLGDSLADILGAAISVFLCSKIYCQK